MTPSQAAILNKQDHPERYCPRFGCIWRRDYGPCPQHQGGAHLSHWPDMPLLEKLRPGEPDPRD